MELSPSPGENAPATEVILQARGLCRSYRLGEVEVRALQGVDLRARGTGWEVLGDGFQADAEIQTWSAPDVLVVPEGAVFRHQKGWAVFVHQQGRAVRREFRAGHRDGRRVEVLGGLEEGEEVVLFPGDLLRDD